VLFVVFADLLPRLERFHLFDLRLAAASFNPLTQVQKAVHVKTMALLSWSSGKDCAWALHLLRQRGDVEVVGLATTFNEAFQRVAMHGVRMELVELQAEAARLPLWTIPLPWPCTNEMYEERMWKVIERARSAGIQAFAFGDLHLEDVRAYREKQLAGTGLDPLFPVWGTPDNTAVLARSMIAAGLCATLACVDPNQLAPSFVGRKFDQSLLDELPDSVDPCGERGEFHTFCHAGPMFDAPIPICVGATVERDGFWFADLLLRGTTNLCMSEKCTTIAQSASQTE
jgi:uncharacterized protein (TIGR00290 family)